jgi:hypothetical protein
MEGGAYAIANVRAHGPQKNHRGANDVCAAMIRELIPP